MHAYLSQTNCHLPIPVPVFGAWIHQRRLKLGLSISQAAEASGLGRCEWQALEDGWVPDTTDEHLLRSIASTLEVRFDALACAVAPLVMHFAAAVD